MTCNYLGVYLGIKGYGTDDIASKSKAIHLFFVNNEEKEFLISTSNNYLIQNTLQTGYIYQFETNDDIIISVTLLDRGNDQIKLGTIDSISANLLVIDQKPIEIDHNTKAYKISIEPGQTHVNETELKIGDSVKILMKEGKAKIVYKSFISKVYKPPIEGIPGLKTLKNFLTTVLSPVGTTLYVFGGGWNWQDQASSNQQMTIGISPSWIDFFQMNDDHYEYKNLNDPSKSYYMYRDMIQYYWAGLDCSAFVGWAVYNIVEKISMDVSKSSGYGCHSTYAAKKLSENGWGTWTRDLSNGFRPGEIFSMDGHVWISIGTCDDGSVVIVHSSPSKSKSGHPGGGVQISAINPNNTETKCEAYELASHYMVKYFPLWSDRYEAFLNDYDRYTKIAEDKNAGKFYNMKPAEILARIFGEL